MKKNQFDNFDEFAHNYRDIHNEQTRLLGVESDYFADFKVKEMARLEGDNANKPMHILDYGCGDGIVSRIFSKYFKNSRVTGVDVSSESIAVARSKPAQNVSYSIIQGDDIPLPDQSVDIIFIAMVLHHINFNKHQAIISEFLRVLVPGGRLYIFEHNPFNPVTRYFVNTCPFDEDAQLLSPSYLTKMLRLNQLGLIDVSYLFFLPRHRVLKSLLFIENYLRWLPLGGQYCTKAVK
ncbi:MAG TPA: class I SAM-dependent methyltransferase [Chitinophagales bacterium]|nr:class I SAM-dependent methyltransferase [Chitinophagales bacterium]